AISHNASGNLFVIATPLNNGWAYRVDYPYYSWAETIVRPSIPRPDFSAAINALNEIENNEAGRWVIDSSELASAIKFSDINNQLTASQITPDVVARALADALNERLSADAHHA